MGNKLKIQLLCVVGSLTLMSCGNVDITPTTGEVYQYSSLSTFCTLPPKEIGLYTKIMFVVDQSGSNGNTDPSKDRRRDAITNFFNKHSANKYIDWGFISFQDSAATPFIQDPYFQPAGNFQAAIDEFSANGDAGGTPYKAAIFEVTRAITLQMESQTDENESNYEIIFLSDGVPTDYGSPIPDGEIYADIERLVKLADGRIHFSTVYYNVGGADNGASARLEEMSKVGKGKFLDASNGGDINIDELIVGGSSKESYLIKDFFVYNLNSTLCDSGIIGADSDADGLCDSDEDYYNSYYSSEIGANSQYAGKAFNKQKRNSFSEIYSDLFILRNLQGEGLPTCSASEAKNDLDHDLLNECEERFLVNRNPKGPTLSWTNEMLANPKYTSNTNYDSDGDGIIDSLEFFFFKEKGGSLDYDSINNELFGTSYYDLFKNHVSKIYPEKSSPYNIDIRQIERNLKGENCYTFGQQTLPMYNVKTATLDGTENLDLVHNDNENVVLVYYIMTPENDPDGKGVLRYSYQKIKNTLSEPQKSIDLAADRFDYIYAK